MKRFLVLALTAGFFSSLVARADIKDSEGFKAEGWWEEKPGIFVKWCKNASYFYPKEGDCPLTQTFPSIQTVFRMMVWWRRDRDCGKIGARIWVIQNEKNIVDRTGDFAYAKQGQKVLLTFSGRRIIIGGRLSPQIDRFFHPDIEWPKQR